MSNTEPIKLSRDCIATTIPYGEKITLDAGAIVKIVQQLGGSFTISTEYGNLLRIDGHDADALGLEVAKSSDVDDSGTFEMSKVTDVLGTIYDPEIPVSIVELGLIYRCDEIMDDDGKRKIEIDMTMTAAGCGMGDVLSDDAIRLVGAIPGVDEVDVNVVWDPPWGMDKMSDAAKLQLGML